MEAHRLPFHHILCEKEPPEQCTLVYQQLIWVLNAAGKTASRYTSIYVDLQMTSSTQANPKKKLSVIPSSTQNHIFSDVVQGSHPREYFPTLSPCGIFASKNDS